MLQFALELTITELPCTSFSKRGLVYNLSYENEFYLHVNENSLSYEKLCTKTRFEKEVRVAASSP